MLNQHIFVVLLRELFDSGGMFLASPLQIGTSEERQIGTSERKGTSEQKTSG